MPNWLESMQQSFEFYTVKPNTWMDDTPITSITSCTINRDSDVETLGSAIFDITESIGECYLRVYLVTVQNGVRERFPLGTYLVQTPSSGFNGKSRTTSADAYTPLIELKENPPPIGYYVEKNKNIMNEVYRITSEHARAPVSQTMCDTKIHYDFVANTDDTWMTFLSDLAAAAEHTFDIDEMGRILFSPRQDTASLVPVWTYDDGNSSILQPAISLEHDLYEIPNVVEVVYSSGDYNYFTRVINDDSDSPISTANRGREVLYRDTAPNIPGNPTENEVREYAEKLLKSLSTIEYTMTYTHGYCPARVGDCIRMNHSRAGIQDVKAKIVSQSIKCAAGCQVTEKAVFTKKLWR